MELNAEFDVDMHDEDVLASTEAFTHFTETSPHPLSSNGQPHDKHVPGSSISALSGAGVSRRSHQLEALINPRKDAPKPAKFEHLPYATAQTGLVYDVRMRFHVEMFPTEDDSHPEDPRRILAIYEALKRAGLVWQDDSIGSPDFYMGRIDTRLVTKDEVCRVHTEKHWDWIQSLSSMTAEQMQQLPATTLTEQPHLSNYVQHPGQRLLDSVYMSTNTPYCAALSAGGAIEACRAVMLGKVKNVLAVIRPPGHHAEREDVKGFCFYDNVSIATKACQEEFGESCRKVFILDWDVHHGNGIQQSHYDDPNVLYISLHVHNGNFYPENSYRDGRVNYGDSAHCGEGAGLGTNINIPWRTDGMGDADYLYAFQQLVMPVAIEFQPDLVIIAAGFDAADGDMLGGCHVTPAGYAHMTHMLMSLAEGRVAVCLEGGYNLDSIARSAVAVARTLMGEPPERLENTSPTEIGVSTVRQSMLRQSKFWSCLYPKDLSERLAGPLRGESLDHIVRQWQAKTMWDDCEMSPLFVHNETLSKSYENQVLATPNYATSRPLLVILHDPPEAIASPDPRTGKIELHNTWVTDTVKTYVNWAAKQGFAVIDVNLPKQITPEGEPSEQHTEERSPEERIAEATHLLTYLWENYIDLGDSTHVFLMGTNIGTEAIIKFLKADEERAQRSVTKAISFIEDATVRACKLDSDERWYYKSSLVYVSAKHPFWESDAGQAVKIKRKWGHILQSHEKDITEMLVAYREAVCNMLLEETQHWRENKAVSDDDEDAMDVTSLPPVSNFAQPSPARANNYNAPRTSNVDSPSARRGRNSQSPSKPPVGNFALSPKQRLLK